jgi:hypothetical protein
LYFGGHFGFKMATIPNRNGRNMVQHVLLPVHIHFHWNLFIFEFLTIFLILSYAMWSCTFKGWCFQNGCRCHGNDQNAKKMKNAKMIIACYSPNRNWWNLTGITSTSIGTK